MNITNRIIITITLITAPLFSFSQVVEQAVLDSTGQQRAQGRVLSGGGVRVNPDPLMPPRLNLKTYKLSANISGSWWDFYLLNSVPTVVANNEDSVESFANEILNQTGGILNVALSKVGYFANGHDDLNKDIRGAQIDFRAGAKLLDPPTSSYSEFLVPIFQSSLDLRYLIPLSSGKIKNKAELRNKMVGNLSFRVYATYMKVFADSTYNVYYQTRKGNPPNNSVFVYNYEMNLFISNELFVSFGQSFSNVETIPNRTFISLSYSNFSQ